LEGEKLLSLEFVYDLMGENTITTRREERLVRISATQNPDDIRIDESILPIVSAQKTSRAVRKAIERLDGQRYDEALEILERMLRELEDFNRPALVDDSIKAIQSMILNIHRGWEGTRGRKSARYSSRSLGRRSSKEYWSGKEDERPSFKDIPRTSE
jgi:hypothetical protein